MTTSNSQRQHRLPRPSLGRTQDPERDERIIKAAIALLEQDGYERMTLEKVAATAGVSKATLYRRWKSKAPLVADAMSALGYPGRNAERNVEGKSFRDDLVTVLHQGTDRELRRTKLFVSVFDAACRNEDLRNLVEHRFSEHIQTELETLIASSQSYGVNVTDDQHRVGIAIQAVIALLIHSSRMNLDIRPEDIIDDVLLPLLK